VVATGKHTGRAATTNSSSATPSQTKSVWWGKVNKPFPQEKVRSVVFEKMERFLEDKEVFVLDAFVGTHPEAPHSGTGDHAACLAQPVHPHHAAAAKPGEYDRITDPFTIIDLPAFQTSKDEDGTNGPKPRFLVDFQKKLTLIANTEYAGEMKKSAFSLMNFVPAAEGHDGRCTPARTSGPQGDTAVFFGPVRDGQDDALGRFPADADRR